MLTPQQIEALADAVVDAYAELDTDMRVAAARGLSREQERQQVIRAIQSAGSPRAIERAIIATYSEAVAASIASDSAIYATARAAGLISAEAIGADPTTLRAVLGPGVQRAVETHNLVMTAAVNAVVSEFTAILDRSMLNVAIGTQTGDQAIARGVDQLARGQSRVTYVSATGSIRTDTLYTAVRRSVVTGVNQLTDRISSERMDRFGVEWVQVSAHAGARPEHAAWQGQVMRRSELAQRTGYGAADGLLGVNCVVGDTVVSGPRPEAGYRRAYTGEIIVLGTARGKKLTVTPNHPILTPKGWVAASLLGKGDNVVCRRGHHRVGEIGPNDYQAPARIKDVFGALEATGQVYTCTGTAKDFHCDGITNTEVEVVYPDRLLRNGLNSSLQEHSVERGLGVAADGTRTFDTQRALLSVGNRAFHATYRLVGRAHKCATLILRHAPKSLSHCLATIRSRGMSILGQTLTDDHLRAFEELSDRLFGHSVGLIHLDNKFVGDVKPPSVRTESGFVESSLNRAGITSELASYVFGSQPAEVEVDYIIYADVREASTHVYNLQTVDEWYYAGGIVTHNCRHSYAPFFPGVSEPTDYSNLDSLDNDEEYALSQRQREAERKIRTYESRARIYEAGGEQDKADSNRERAGMWREVEAQTAAQRRDFPRANRRIPFPGEERW